MARDRIDFEVGATLQDTMDAIRTGASGKGWDARGDRPTRLEVRKPLGGTPVTLDVALSPVGERQTSVRVDGRMRGWGPLVKRSLGSALNDFQAAVIEALPAHWETTSSAAATQAEALASLAKLHERGLLTREEFESEKAKILNEG